MASYSSSLSSIAGIRHSFDEPREAPEELAHCHQVHGDALLAVSEETPTEQVASYKADGLLTGEKRIVGIQTADCLPVLFAAASGSHVAAVHAGWRGLHLGILVRTVERFASLGVSASELVVAIGPAIGPCCFEVSREMHDAFEKDWGRLWRESPRKPLLSVQPSSSCAARSRATRSRNDLWVDLDLIARLQLVDAKVRDDLIEDVGHCTYCGPGNLASHRRGTHEGVKSARQWSWISRI